MDPTETAPIRALAPSDGSKWDAAVAPRQARAAMDVPTQIAGPEAIEPAVSSVDLSTWDPSQAVRAAANQELRQDLLRISSERLRRTYVVAAALLFGYLLLSALLVPALASEQEVLRSELLPLVAALLLSLAFAVAAGQKRLPRAIACQLGYVYLILLALALGVFRHLGAPEPLALRSQLSPVALPIMAYGALVPATPRTALAAYLGAAAMDPLAFALIRSDAPDAFGVALLAFASPLCAAAAAYAISLIVHRLSEGIVKAREVGSYRLIERIGSGGMAEVWRAQHVMLVRPAAVKLIRPSVLSGVGGPDAERLLRLFLREARTTASLTSPHTISLYDFGITREGAFYYVMELLDGIDLQTLVTNYGPQPSERTAHLLAQACLSLGEAHQRDFVHRDVKPANLFACRLGEDSDFVKVLDFGLVLDRHPTPEELEDEKRFVGTPSVMAPEMVRFHAPVDRRADIYALGCVGYFLLTGKRVFDAETRHDMLVMHAHQKPIPPSRRVELSIHPELERIVMECLEKNPNRRPQSMRELRDALLGITFEHPWTEERARLWWQSRKHEDRSRREKSGEGLPPETMRTRA
jgi:serine/threonine-protein kinase